MDTSDFPEPRVLIVSPVRNESAHVEKVAAAMAAQTRPPDLWLVADDSSDDGTYELLVTQTPEVPFMRVIRAPQTDGEHTDRLAVALEARAFNSALRGIDLDGFTHIGKLDGDIELPPDYLEEVLDAFARDPELGIAGGTLVEPRGSNEIWTKIVVPLHHVHGGLRLYSMACFNASGGVREQLGWDTIDLTYARMRGYRTRRLPDLIARHHRPYGSADGTLRGVARGGECAYATQYGFGWVFMRSFKTALRRKPRGLAGIVFLWGYVHAALRRAPRVEDPAFRSFARRELRGRIWAVADPVRIGRRVRSTLFADRVG